jgi:DNA-directed RNA polymerase specialized sigma24 family protein
MTHNAAEIFIMQLARAAAKQANKFLAARGLHKADRDDVISAAILWCWENQANYSLTTTLETWFMNAIRDAYKNLQRDELPVSDESLENMGGEDTTFGAVSAESDVRSLLRQLTAPEREIVQQMLDGVTWREMLKQGVSETLIKQTKEVLRVLRKEMPDNAARAVLARTSPKGGSDDADDALSAIDVELERLDFPPPAGKDCPPCYRCMWFEGFMPAGKRDTRMDIEDEEVREAVKSTEARKIEIAQQVRDGLFADR